MNRQQSPRMNVRGDFFGLLQYPEAFPWGKVAEHKQGRKREDRWADVVIGSYSNNITNIFQVLV